MTPPDEPPTNPNDPSWPQPEQPYGQQQPYGQAPYGQAPYGQPGYGGPVTPPHPSAMTSLVLGLVALGGILLCAGVTLPLAPFAWFIGGRAVKEIDADPGRFSGREQAQAGRIMGMVGTGLLILGTIALVALIAVGVAVSESNDLGNTPDVSSSTSDPSF